MPTFKRVTGWKVKTAYDELVKSQGFSKVVWQKSDGTDITNAVAAGHYDAHAVASTPTAEEPAIWINQDVEASTDITITVVSMS